MNMLTDIRQKIEPIVQKIMESEGFDLIELKLAGHKNDLMIQVTADKPSGGINIEECAIINRLLAAAIEQEQFLPPSNFSLEVSSPGLDRPLVKRRDFVRFVGQVIHFWLKEPVAGKKEWEGVLTELGEATMTVEAPKKQRLAIPLSSIEKGKLII